jgi:hypothetical protein
MASNINSPFEQYDDVWLAARALDEACKRQPPYSGDNPLPYSIVGTDVYPDVNVGFYWPARPMVWELYGLDMAPVDLKNDDWSLLQISKTYIDPLEKSLGAGSTIANTLILVEAASDAFERFLQNSDYLVRWQPVIRPEEWARINAQDEGSISGTTTLANIGSNRLFAAPSDATALGKPGQLTWMRKALEGYLKQYAAHFLTGELKWQPAGTPYPMLSGSVDASPFGADEGLITEALFQPRQSIWIGELF